MRVSGIRCRRCGSYRVCCRNMAIRTASNAIGYTAPRPTVAMTGAPQPMILLTAAFIMLQAHSRPMIQSIAETNVTTVSHLDLHFLSAPPGHRRDPAVSTQGMVISFRQGLRGFCEHRGSYDSSHSGQGTEKFNVTMLALAQFTCRIDGQLLQDRFHSFGNIDLLLSQQTQSADQQHRDFASRLSCARSQQEWLGSKFGQDFIGRKTSDAIF